MAASWHNWDVRNALTSTDALILSLLDWPDGPHELPEVFDAFARVVDSIASGTGSVGAIDEGRLLVGHASAPELLFRATPILADGWVAPSMVPDAWHGHLTRSLLAAYFRSDWLMWPREPSWGAQMPFADGPQRVGQALEVGLLNPAKRPFIDPLRDLAGEDGPEWLPLSVELDGEWAGLFTPWESTDAFVGGTRPGAAWLARRTLPATATGIRLWWQLRGWRDAGDAERYRGHWEDSLPITVYLGWPAYAVAAASDTVPCANCGRTTNSWSPVLWRQGV